MADHHNELCAHPGCQCLAPKGSKYCCTWCEEADKSPEAVCSCGHPGCQESPQFVG
jgi:hypothetical protein